MAQDFPELHQWWSARQDRQNLQPAEQIENQRQAVIGWLKSMLTIQTATCPNCGSTNTRLVEKSRPRPTFQCLRRQCPSTFSLLAGTPLAHLGHPELWVEFLQGVLDGLGGYDLKRRSDRVLTLPDGKVLNIYHWMLPYRDVGGSVIGLIAGWMDIGERQRLPVLVEEAREAADEARNIADDANRAKTTFLATMSHEIRTPMNAVIGMLELALEKADQGVRDRFAIEVASGVALRLQDLIGDILDIMRIESGKLSLAPERANLRELIESQVRIFDGVARQKHLQLLLDLDVRIN